MSTWGSEMKLHVCLFIVCWYFTMFILQRRQISLLALRGSLLSLATVHQLWLMDSVLRIQVQKMELGQDLQCHAHRTVSGEGLMVLGVYVTQDFSDPWMITCVWVRSCLFVCPSVHQFSYPLYNAPNRPVVSESECATSALCLFV